MICALRRLLALSLLATNIARSAEPQPYKRTEILNALRIPHTLQSRVRFDHLTTADGLSHDSVFAVMQDRHGFMWFGTQGGLDRYDGYQITHYRHDPEDPKSISSDFISILLEDRRGSIWAGRQTLSRFDPATEKFTRFTLPGENSEPPAVIYTMIEDRSGFLWLGMRGMRALYRLDPATGKFTEFDLGRSMPEGVGSGVFRINQDPAGIFWLNTDIGLVRFDPSTGKSMRHPQSSPDRRPIFFLRRIAQDCDGKLWKSTEAAENVLSPAGGCLAWKWSVPDPESLAADINLTVLHGATGGVWMGTEDGLKVYDPSTGATGVLRHNASDRYSLSTDEILSIAVDRSGSLWVGTKGGGVNRFSPATLRFGAWRPNPADPASLGDEYIRAIARDRHGAVWIGTYNRGLDRFDPISGKFQHFRNDPRNPKSLSNDQVYSIHEDRSGDLWFGTFLGANRLDRGAHTFTQFPKRRWQSQVYSLLEDRRGRFWYGSALAAHLLDRQTGELTSLSKTGGLSIYEDRNGVLWFASTGRLYRMDASGSIRQVPLSQTPANENAPVQTNFIYEDPGGLLWLATETGLIRFNPRSEESARYTVREGLPDNVIQCILPDQAGNLWLSTNKGLSRFDPRDSKFTNYHQSDGLQGEQFSRKACFVDSAGIMYFGGLHGFNMFDARLVPARPAEPGRVVLTELRINGTTVPVRSGSMLPKPVWEIDALNFTPQSKEFSFDFAALNNNDPVRTQYRFQLENLENRWTQVDSRRRSARYTAVPPGTYRFRVQASMDGKNWSGQEASIAISVAPPWWKTTWSRLAFVAGFIFLLGGAYKLRVRVLKQQRVRLQKLVDERTAELAEAKDHAEQANLAKSTFLANMSHELRTPLNAILGFSVLLSDKAVSEDQRRDLETINRSGEHLLTLIDNVLDLAKIESGRKELSITPCDIRTLVQDVSDMMQVRASAKHLTLELIDNGGAATTVRGDALKLRAVLINLLGNAVKFTEHGSVTLRLDIEPKDRSERVLLRLEVEDTGIGIDPADQARIFEPFEQVANASVHKGTGLGLAISRQLVELMGGAISVQSEPGKGSRFRVELPVDLAEPIATTSFGQARVIGLESDQPEYRILVVEDESVNAVVLERLLRNVGFEVRVAANGRDGIEVFRQWKPQVIWMDLRMPVMDGFEATRQIRNLPGGTEVKIAGLTASAFESQRSEALAAGLDDYLRKPCRPDELFECMARLIGVRYQRDTTIHSGPQNLPKISQDAISDLPSALRSELHQAVLSLAVNRIWAVVQKIAEQNPDLGGVLACHVEEYAFTPILRVIDSEVTRTAAGDLTPSSDHR